ncbi:MAG: D-alanyl-D-alanine carboxypeptidase family protein [Bacillota bacterium]|nr:D-alanyl-D-alanine carboxypeptidase family protein [Bacillota bacterium]
MKRFTALCILSLFILNFIFIRSISADDTRVDTYAVNYDQPLMKPASEIKSPVINALAAIVVDTCSGRILYQKNAFTRRAIASTTKIMTAIVALENCNLDEKVTVSKRADSVGGSSVGIRTGQIYRLGDLMYGLMLNSGNDAAIAIAEHVGGSVEDFVSMMNRKAEELGLKDTSFKSPHGLDSDGHYSTAYDLAQLTRYALKNPTFAKIVSTKSISLPGLSLYNTNDMLSIYPGADGVKTGYTGMAGRCLVTSVTRNNWKIISVVLGSPTISIRSQCSKTILDFAYDNYKPYKLLNADQEISEIPVTRGISKNVPVLAVDDINIPLTQMEAAELKKEIVLPDNLPAPVSKGIEIGNIKFVADGKVIAESPLKTGKDIRRKGLTDYMKDIFGIWGRLIRPEG